MHLPWGDLFGLILCTTIPFWSWYVGIQDHHRHVFFISIVKLQIFFFCFPCHALLSCLQVKQELVTNEPFYKSSRRLLGLVSSCLQELSFPWYVSLSMFFPRSVSFDEYLPFILLIFFRIFQSIAHVSGCTMSVLCAMLSAAMEFLCTFSRLLYFNLDLKSALRTQILKASNLMLHPL